MAIDKESMMGLGRVIGYLYRGLTDKNAAGLRPTEAALVIAAYFSHAADKSRVGDDAAPAAKLPASLVNDTIAKILRESGLGDDNG